MTEPEPYYGDAADAEAARRRHERRELQRAIARGLALPQAADLFPALPGTPKPVGPQLTLGMEDEA